MKQTKLQNTDKVLVCSECKTHLCVRGELMCYQAENADIIEMTVEQLTELGEEHPSHWEPKE